MAKGRLQSSEPLHCEYCIVMQAFIIIFQGGMFEDQLKSVNYQNPPWSTHYPELVNIFKDHPCTPVYNEVTDSEYCGEEFIDISADQIKQWMDTVANNTKFTC